MNHFSSPKNKRFVAFIVTAGILLCLILMGLLIFVLSGLLAYKLVLNISKKITTKDLIEATAGHHYTVRTCAGVIIVTTILLGFMAIGTGIHYAFNNHASVAELLTRVGDIIGSTKAALPAILADYIPQNNMLFSSIGIWIKDNAAFLGSFGLMTLKGVGFALLGMLMGSMVAIAETKNHDKTGEYSHLLLTQIGQLREFFWFVASAQVKISGINTLCTIIYLYVILPSFGVELSMRPALVTSTFIAGLLPVVGNLVANTFMTIISLDYSLSVAISSLGYLMLIHKFEYIWSGKIIGEKVKARVWEILLSMIIMEHLLGVSGLVISPIFYAWLKSEWRLWDAAPEDNNSENSIENIN
jgi:predicted PurR-regulated permease PerM